MSDGVFEALVPALLGGLPAGVVAHEVASRVRDLDEDPGHGPVCRAEGFEAARNPFAAALAPSAANSTPCRFLRLPL